MARLLYNALIKSKSWIGDARTQGIDLNGDPYLLKKEEKDKLLSLLRSAKIFVSTHETYNVDILNKITAEGLNKLVLSMPFKTIWIESYSLSKAAYDNTLDPSQDFMAGTLIHEVEPYVFEFLAYILKSTNGEVVGTPLYINSVDCREQSVNLMKGSDDIRLQGAMHLLAVLLQMSDGVMATEKVSTVAHIPTPNGKTRPREINQIIRIIPRNEINRAKPIFSREIDYSHRWTVRGHWRTVKTIGKDRDGNPYLGFTWVKDHIKGPEDKPLVDNKIRITTDSKK